MSQPSISFIIPVLNEQAIITGLLTSLKSPDVELIVVDGGSTDATVELASELADQVLHSAPGRARQMNLGAARARGRVLAFLHADSQLTSTWLAEFLSLAKAGQQWGYSRLRLSGAVRWFRVIETAINWRTSLTSVASGDQCLWAEAELFKRLGGFAEISLMEDIELCKRLRSVARPAIIGEPLVTSSRRWERQGIIRTVLLMWWLRLAYFMGASPEKLAKSYGCG
jgi:rSAM/selenodomain-associated transferase 2